MVHTGLVAPTTAARWSGARLSLAIAASVALTCGVLYAGAQSSAVFPASVEHIGYPANVYDVDGLDLPGTEKHSWEARKAARDAKRESKSKADTGAADAAEDLNTADQNKVGQNKAAKLKKAAQLLLSTDDLSTKESDKRLEQAATLLHTTDKMGVPYKYTGEMYSEVWGANNGEKAVWETMNLANPDIPYALRMKLKAEKTGVQLLEASAKAAPAADVPTPIAEVEKTTVPDMGKEEQAAAPAAAAPAPAAAATAAAPVVDNAAKIVQTKARIAAAQAAGNSPLVASLQHGLLAMEKAGR